MIGSKWRAGALLTATLVVGILVGAGGMMLVGPHPPFGRPPRPPAFADFLSDKLDLTPTQHDSLLAILDRHAGVMDSLWKDFGPRFQADERATRSEIAAQLNPDQRRKFEEMSERMERMRRRGGRPGPGGRDGPGLSPPPLGPPPPP